MKRDIEFRELIKIISEIENKSKETIVKNEERIVYTKEYIETKFSEDIPLIDKLNLLKIYESQYNLNSLKDMQELFLTEAKLLEDIKPNVYTKGADYTLETLPEREIVLKNNIKVEFIEFVQGKSTTNVIKKINEK